MARILVALLALTACNPIVCQARVSVHVEPDTRPPVVVARCDGVELARRVCQDGGRQHRDGNIVTFLCDGVTMTTVKVEEAP